MAFVRRSNLMALLCAVTLFGCVERAPDLSPADRERLREYVGTEAPSPEHELNVEFDNGVTLLGYDVTDEELTPGEATTITWHWRATQNLEDQWRIFTHVADSTGESRFNQDGQGVVRELYQPGRWEAGQYIRDVQEVTIPADWNDNRAVFFLGLWNGPHRLAVRRGQNDGENRVRALSIPVAVTAAPAAEAVVEPERPAVRPPPAITAGRAAEITIDGQLDEVAWQQTRTTGAFVNTLNGGPADFRAVSRVLWDDDNLYVSFEVADDFIRNSHEDRDAHLWEQDAVEVMIDPDGDGRNYFEMQVSPSGVLFDTRYDTRRQPQPIGHADWNPEIDANVVVNGTVNDEGADEGYVVEMAIPWGAFAVGEPPATRPAANQTWRMNFYVMDARQGNAPQRSAGWSPPMVGDFHMPARFGRVIFQAPRPAPAAQAAAPAAPTRPLLQLPPNQAAALREQIGRRGPRGLRPPAPVRR